MEMMIILLDAGSFVNETDNLGKTAMHYAAKYGKLEWIELLYDYGGDPSIPDNSDVLL